MHWRRHLARLSSLAGSSVVGRRRRFLCWCEKLSEEILSLCVGISLLPEQLRIHNDMEGRRFCPAAATAAVVRNSSFTATSSKIFPFPENQSPATAECCTKARGSNQSEDCKKIKHSRGQVLTCQEKEENHIDRDAVFRFGLVTFSLRTHAHNNLSPHLSKHVDCENFSSPQMPSVSACAAAAAAAVVIVPWDNRSCHRRADWKKILLMFLLACQQHHQQPRSKYSSLDQREETFGKSSAIY